uniref:BTB domain-containing protein n=1 Tax=Ditylenchus dipsaci TaxID=166011 RepID=A0A915D5Z2_9BILA
MKRKYVVNDSNEAETDVSEALSDQQKNVGDLYGRMEAMINNKFVEIRDSIHKKLSENKDAIMQNRLEIRESLLKTGMVGAEKKGPFGLKRNFLEATFNIDDLLSTFSYSKTINYAGAKWCLAVKKTEEGHKLGAYVVHKADSVNISYDTNYTIRLLGSSENIQKEGKSCLAYESPGKAFRHSFLLWSRLVNITNGFVDEKGNFKMEVEFSVTGNTTACGPLNPQFLISGFVESNCTLLVEDRRFPVNKELLSAYSNYFKTLLFGEFREKDQDEIEMKDVSAEEFIHLLKVIYPPFDDADVNSNNVGSLLRLADYYQVKAVSDRCSKYLRKCAISEVPLIEKLLYAQNYRLLELLEHCVKEFKTFDDVKNLRSTGKYSLLDKDIKLQIFEHFASILHSNH